MNLFTNFIVSTLCVLAVVFPLNHLLWEWFLTRTGMDRSKVAGFTRFHRLTAAHGPALCLAGALCALYFCRHDGLVATHVSYITQTDGRFTGRMMTDQYGQRFLVRHTWGGNYSVQQVPDAVRTPAREAAFRLDKF